MKIYVAGSFDHRRELRDLRQNLVEDGHVVLSAWIDLEDAFPPLAVCAHMDLMGVEASDALLLVTGGLSSGGQHTEFGYALAQKKLMTILGEQGNPFHHLPGVYVFDSMDKARVFFINSDPFIKAQVDLFGKLPKRS